MCPAFIAGGCNSNEHDLAHDEGEADAEAESFPSADKLLRPISAHGETCSVSGDAGDVCAPHVSLEGATQMNRTSPMTKEKPLAEAECFPSADNH